MAGTVITKKGLQLIAKLVASGTALSFTRVAVGIGSVPPGYDPGSMTDLNNYKMDGLIYSCSASGDEASIIMQISSIGVTTGFTITEAGLFATDPDDGEVLYAYLDMSKDPQYIYPENSAISKFVEMTLIVKVGTVDKVTAYINPGSLLTRDGDISENVVKTLEPIETKFPIPSAGEKVKTFFGKILTFLRNIKPLESDVTYYVATNGSDVTGNGTQEKPFKTIQYTVNKIPKDLNGNVVTINIADGNYDEVVKIFGLHGGALNIKSLSNPDTLNNLCKVKKISVVYCEAMIQFYGIYLTQTNDIAFNSVACSYIYITACQAIESALNSYGFEFIYAKVRMRGCKSLNHSACATAYYSSLSSENWTTDSSGITHGMVASTSGQIIMTGTQPNGGVKQFYQLDGGQFIRENGTQITNVTNSGLACTWGTIQSGYFRHGNENAATITVQVSITTTASLTAGTTYSITGFPKNSTGNAIAVNCHQEGLKDWCQINGGDGTLFFTPKVAIASGKTLHFNCTYLTTI